MESHGGLREEEHGGGILEEESWRRDPGGTQKHLEPNRGTSKRRFPSRCSNSLCVFHTRVLTSTFVYIYIYIYIYGTTYCTMYGAICGTKYGTIYNIICGTTLGTISAGPPLWGAHGCEAWFGIGKSQISSPGCCC